MKMWGEFVCDDRISPQFVLFSRAACFFLLYMYVIASKYVENLTFIFVVLLLRTFFVRYRIMADSDDSFHSASEGEELSHDVKEVNKVVEEPAETLHPIIEKPIVEEKLDITGPYVDADKSAEWTKAVTESQPSVKQEVSPEPSKKHLKIEDGWEDFGEQADTEADSEPEVEKIEDDDGEYFHRQLMDPKKIPSSRQALNTEKDNNADDASQGLFDWSALQNVVSAVGKQFPYT